MAQTVANLTDVLKDAWTSDRIKKQFFSGDTLLKRIGQLEATMIGKNAIVPIHKGRSGGYTSVGSGGGSLNPADAQKVDQASYTMVYHWFQLQLETGAINQAMGSNLQSAVASKDLEFEGTIDDVRLHATRQLVSDGTGRIAQCTTTSGSATVNLLATGLGPQAVDRGFLYAGLPVDIGTTADSDFRVTGAVIQDVSVTTDSSGAYTAATIVIDSSITTASTDYVSIANPNSATATNAEMNGLRNIAGGTAALGGLDPANSGEGFWQPALVDTSTTVLSIPTAMRLARAVRQKTGQGGEVWTSLKQKDLWYEILQNQVRFDSDSVDAGGSEDAKFRGLAVNAIPEIYDTDWFYLNLADLKRIVGGIKDPTWATDLEGNGATQGLQWAAGTTAFKNAVVWPFNVATQRRNTSAAMTALA